MHTVEPQESATLQPLLTQRPGSVACYKAYGLTILSELPLPEFQLVEKTCASPDVIVSLRPGEARTRPAGEDRSLWSVTRDDARFYFRDVGSFRVVQGREIIISPEPAVEPSLLRLYVEGMMMAALLHQRGLFVLHASVVQLGDHAVAFLGHVGAGKSSTAAALHARGRAVVTDDNAAIDLASRQPSVLPAFPTVKVFPKIAVALGYDEDSLAEMHASQIKRARSVSKAFPTCPVPLRGMYVLTRDAPDEFAPLSRTEYLLEIVRNSVPTRWGLAGTADHLRECGRVTSLIPAWRIRTFNTLDELAELAERIEEHALEASVGSA